MSDFDAPKNFNKTAGTHYAFAHMLRGFAAVIVVLGAHIMGIFWLNTPTACNLLGITTCTARESIPSIVLGLNYFKWLSYGHFGVALFFLISGFVIPFSLIRFNSKQFLIARFFRIYPTYWVALLCSLLMIMALHHGALSFGSKEIVYHLALLRDLAWIPSIDGVSWTLEIEIKFYLLCALIASTIVFGRVKQLCLTFFLLGILSIVFSYIQFGAVSNMFHWTLNNPWYGILHALSMSSVFIIYMLLGTLFNWHCRHVISTRLLLLLIIFGFSWFALVWHESDFKIQFFYGVLNYFFALVVFSFTYTLRERIRPVKFVNWLGNISYPLYAVHPIVGYGLLYWLVVINKLSSWIAIPLCLTACFTLATVLHHLIELPTNNFGKKLANNLSVPNYVKNIWHTRYFWSHLVLSDLRSRWRRSFMGMSWSIIQPLGMTLLLSIVFSRLFHVNIVFYAPYILSGLIVWEFIGASLTGGSLAFVQADAYIKQCKHPLAIYTLRLVLSNLIVFALASLVLWVWAIIVLPNNFGWSWLSIVTFFPLIVAIAWPMATLLAYVGTRFRDIPHAMGLILQVLWFISPVYFEASMFRKGGLNGLVDYNPVYHLLQIIRAPILDGQWPTMTNYLFCMVTVLIVTILAVLVGRKAERKVIFYL